MDAGVPWKAVIQQNSQQEAASLAWSLHQVVSRGTVWLINHINAGASLWQTFRVVSRGTTRSLFHVKHPPRLDPDIESSKTAASMIIGSGSSFALSSHVWPWKTARAHKEFSPKESFITLLGKMGCGSSLNIWDCSNPLQKTWHRMPLLNRQDVLAVLFRPWIYLACNASHYDATVNCVRSTHMGSEDDPVFCTRRAVRLFFSSVSCRSLYPNSPTTSG